MQSKASLAYAGTCVDAKLWGLNSLEKFMVTGLLKQIFGSRNDRLLKQYKRIVAQINDLESSIASLDDAGLQAKTAEFKDRLAQGQTLDQILPEAFAVVREASKRA